MLRVENLSSGYHKDINVLNGVSLEVKKGTITSVLGPNGSGKSTLLKTIYGYLKPFSGRVIYNGEDVTNLPPHEKIKKGIAYISQEHGIFHSLTVEENLKAGMWIYRKNKELVKEKLKAVYDRFPILKEKRNVKAGFLSGGQQKLLQFSVALLSNPELILVDEPTAGLSPIASEEVYEILKELKREGKTILLVEQNLRKAIEVSDFAYVLELGKIRYGGDREDFERGLKRILSVWGFEL
ncbi:ABC transporter related protein [Ferroglobus placidus DSM 10642]|uniref:ABC transporter related protein n=1 Tax=Ferroglobus placidus (strain DSM 10642 / AEDII12DO) TaxID=589924 RepID=D3RXW8_FERPA|nr:ABC transporter ATP-binding protein [Ferroglobus placidus]ADC65331.1 ABC transporter related protein [Ferroglobus placidus DSM 10642]